MMLNITAPFNNFLFTIKNPMKKITTTPSIYTAEIQYFAI